MVRVIRVFNKETELHEYDIRLPDIPLDKLQDLFSIPSDNPMYDCYEVNSVEHVRFFNNYISIEFNFKKYDYFLEDE